MAPRTTWRGHLTLAQISCPVRMHPALVRADRLGFQALNRATLNRVQMRPHDPQTGKELSRDVVVRGYEVEPGQFVLIEDRELEELQIDSSRNLILERFIDRATLDTAYFDTPYFLVPDGRAADLAFGLIRGAIAEQKLTGIGRVVLGSRERAVLVEPRGRGMLLTTLRAAHEVRSDDPYFSEISTAPPEDALRDLARRVVSRLAGAFDPRRDFRDRYQEALFHFVQAKRRGERPVLPPAPPAFPELDLRLALERSATALEEAKPAAAAARPRAGSRRAPRRSVVSTS